MARERVAAEPRVEVWARSNALGQRLALKGLDYRVPEEANRWMYMLGGLTAFFLMLLILTGLYLAQFYNPNPLGARDSVLYIIVRAP